MQFTVVENVNMTAEDEEKDVFFIRLSYEGDQTYQAGDWLLFQPRNRPSLVDFVLKLLGLTGDEVFEVRRVGARPIRDALLENFELTQLNPAILNRIQRQYGLDEWADRNEMMAYAEGRDIVDLLESFPQLCELGLEFCQMLSPLSPRYYSIASSMKGVPARTVDLVYKKIVYEHSGRERFGVATCQLSDLAVGAVIEGDFCENKAFKLPEDLAHSQQPIIMVGAGTGLAPYIGFIQELAAAGPGCLEHAWLFFGETYSDTSFLYKDQLLAWRSQGLNLFTAFSRDQAEKHYVQHLLWEQRETVWKLLKAGGVFYLCGDKTRMAKQVEATIKEIMRTVGGLEDVDLDWKEWRRARKVQYDVY
ncbi:MAG: hypothetical protein R3219_06270 [Hydrogenovibrio sp.]|nr:hypothetical protein [Hydrogenovibrio sp.]